MAHQRQQQKLRTRDRILAAARKLFASPGYEQTTVRMIAKEASVAPGSVYTTYRSKEDVLLEIVQERYDEMTRHLAVRLGALSCPAREKLKRAFAEAYAFEHERLALLMKQLGASWSWSHEMEARAQERISRALRFIHDFCAEAHANGEVHRGADVGLLSDVLIALYQRNFRHAWFGRLQPQETAALAARQIDLIFDGAAAQKAHGP